jgi:hypothetical protein
MIREVILHIGLHKTATTSIQASLNDTINLLDNAGILYPTFTINGKKIDNHSIPFVTLFSKRPHLYDVKLDFNKNLDELHPFLCNHYKDQLLAQIEKFSGDKILISGEDISKMGLSQLKRLEQFFKGHVNQEIKFRIIAFVRHPVSRITSSIQENVKHGKTLEELIGDNIILRHTAFESIFSQFENVFSKKNIQIVRFEDALLHAKGPVGYFYSLLGFGEDSLRNIAPTKRNSSFSYEAIVLLSTLNKSFPLFLNGERNQIWESLKMKYIINMPGEKFQLANEKKCQIWESAQDDLIWIYNNYGIEPYEFAEESGLENFQFWGRETIDYLSVNLNKQPDKFKILLFRKVITEILTIRKHLTIDDFLALYRLSKNCNVFFKNKFCYNLYLFIYRIPLNGSKRYLENIFKRRLEVFLDEPSELISNSIRMYSEGKKIHEI